MLDDLRTAVAWLRNDKLVTLVVVLTIALGVGANAAIFSAIESVLLRPFDFPAGERAALLWRGSVSGSLMVPPTREQILAWRDAASLERVEAFNRRRGAWTGHGAATTLSMGELTPGLIDMLGRPPILGRPFAESDLTEGAEPVVLISRSVWRSRFGGVGDIIGRSITIDGTRRTVVGVLPAGFILPGPVPEAIEAATPLALGTAANNAIAILRPGVTLERAQAELTGITKSLAEAANPGAPPQWEARVHGPEFFARRLSDSLVMLMAAVGALLLIACINVANVLLARAHGRQREMAVRSALGASRARLFRQSLVSSVVLGLIGGAAGVGLAYWCADLLLALRPEELAVLDRIRVDRPVLLFATAISLVAGMLFGLAPAFFAAAGDPLERLKSGARTDGGGTVARRFRMGMVVTEVALSFVLLVGAGLLVRSVSSLNEQELGFEPTNLASLAVEPPEWKYADRASREAYAARVLERLRAVPGVAEAAYAGGAPPSVGIFFGDVELEGVADPGEEGSTVFFGTAVGPDYFRTLRQPILRGRAFTADEMTEGANLFVLGESAARKLFGTTDVVGRRMRLSATEGWSTIVGVAGDVRATGLGTTDDHDAMQLYVPDPAKWSSGTFLVRTDIDVARVLPTLEEAIAGVDADTPVHEATTIVAELAGSIGRQRFIRTLLVGLSIVAALMAAIGLYGVLAHLVRQRTREIGIRVALGADPRRVLAMVLRQGGVAALAGIALGGPLAFAGSKLLQSQLHGVGRGDPVTYLGVAGLLAGVALLAALLPARRAAAVEPTEAMRAE